MVNQAKWEKSSEYKIAIMLKVIRAMKSYGFQEWMRRDLKELGLSI